MAILLYTLLLTVAEPPAAYPRAEILAEPSNVPKPSPGSRVLDVRSAEAYQAGHVPGAVHVSASQWRNDFTPKPDAARWAKNLAAVGVKPTTRVVVYGGDDLRETARVWWILRYWGVRDARLLNGGWSAWKSAGGEVSRTVPELDRSSAAWVPQPARLATQAQLLGVLKTPHRPQIVDARSEAEYCGEMHSAKRNGAIPGAIHLEWKELLDPKTKRFKSAEELAKLFHAHGIDPRKPAVTYCQSGGRAAVLAFALELMGGRQVANYYGSWREWGNATDTPIEKKK